MHRTLLQRLVEKGRALSRKHESHLRTAITQIEAVLASVADGMPINESQRQQFNAAALALIEAELSHDQQREAVQKALRATTERYPSIMEMYDTWLVYELYNADTDLLDLFRVSYLIDEQGNVTLSQPIAVRRIVSYEPVSGLSESARGGDGTIRLVEAAVPLIEKSIRRRDGTVPIKIIQPGWGSSGFYAPDVLERDGPTVFTAGTHMYWNHATESELAERPERDLRDLAAVLESDARWEANGPDGPGLYADARVKQGYAAAIEDLAENIGTSINTGGTGRIGEAEGRNGIIVESLIGDPFTSIDFVTKPGAGGKILQLFESARPRPQQPQQEVIVTEQEATQLRESNSGLQSEVARLQVELRTQEAKGVVAEHLATKTTLLEATRQRIAQQMAARTDLPLVEGAIDRAAYITQIEAAIAIEEAYLAAVSGSGQITGMGGSGPVDTQTVDSAALQTSLTESFSLLGLSESAAQDAARGR